MDASPPLIMGLYPFARGGTSQVPITLLEEIPQSLAINHWDEMGVKFLAGDSWAADILTGLHLSVARTFSEAPAFIHRDAAHLMKFWMCLWALKEFGEFLWVDWDVICLRRPDAAFSSWCRAHDTPKFIFIPNYWATVNCGVYYANKSWRSEMERALSLEISQPNDELLWRGILPPDVIARPEFWWGSLVVNLWNRDKISQLKDTPYFTHVRDLNYYTDLEKYKRR